MWLTFRDMVAHALALAMMGQAQPAANNPLDASNPPPLEYRGDSMQVLTKPNRALLRNNIVIRRGDLLVCCESFQGNADDNWAWERFVCTDKVVARRNDETMWADKAEFILETSDLILTGKPILQRGRSVLEGARIIVDTKRDRARIVNPRGRIQSAKEAPSSELPEFLEGELPSRCPLPAGPELRP